ncbi:MAG: DUF2889 domain-containing protein [Geobacteraceae bacterium]|nr:DUF2889 domain-containing protein [Geobacteraceae bacterium]
MSDNFMSGFHRAISFDVSRIADNRIRLTATMRDVYHDILIEVLVDAETLIIEALQATFSRCPEKACPNAAGRLQNLVGVVIGRGLNRRVIDALGGGAGCGNLRVMLLGLLPLAINVKAAEGFDSEEEMLESVRNKLRGSCAGYPEDDTGLA